MARTAAQRAAAPAVDKRTPSQIAVERMAKLAAQGVSAPKMVGALEGVLVEWGRKQLDPSELRERCETLQSDLDVGAQAAEDYVAEAESEAAKVAAGKQLDGLRAAQKRLADVISG